MKEKIIFVLAIVVLLFNILGCSNSKTRVKPTATYNPWRYYKNYHHYSFWHHPRRGGGGYYYKSRHRHNMYPHRNPRAGWYQKRGYSK